VIFASLVATRVDSDLPSIMERGFDVRRQLLRAVRLDLAATGLRRRRVTVHWRSTSPSKILNR
jgi:hypothetical protein